MFRRSSPLSVTVLALTLAAAAVPAIATTAEDAPPAADSSQADATFHGNASCPLMEKPVKQNKFVEVNGERVYVCCSKCRTRVKTDFAKYRDMAYPADQIIDLKNERCPIMGGECDGETSMVFQNYRIQLCCDGCDTKFKKNPRKLLTLLLNPELIALDNEHCPVMTEEPAEPDNFFVHDGVLIDTCCSDCPEMFAEEPTRYLKEAGIDLAKLKAAAQTKRAAKEAEKNEQKDGAEERGD